MKKSLSLGIVLIPIGIFLLIIGIIFLPISVNDYNHSVNRSICTTLGAGGFSITDCTISHTQALIMIAESAAALSLGITALIFGIYLIVHKQPKDYSPTSAEKHGVASVREYQQFQQE